MLSNNQVTDMLNWLKSLFHLKRGQKPDLIKLNLAVEGTGKVRIQDVELLQTPLQG